MKNRMKQVILSRLKGENIHIFARIIAVADVFDAFFSERVYKKPWSIEKTISWMKEQSGNHFDPSLIDIFLENVDLFVTLYNQYTAEK